MNTTLSNPSNQAACLQLQSESGENEDNQWQHECESLLREINRNLDGYDDRVEAAKLFRTPEEAKGKKSGEFELFNQLLIQTGVIEVVVNRCWDLIQSFFDRHSGSSGTMVFPDGSEVTVKGMSTEQALELIRTMKSSA